SRAPSHAYTRKLMRATPRPGASLRDLLPEDAGAEPEAGPFGPASNGDRVEKPRGDNRAPLLVVENLVKEYPRKSLVGVLAKMFKRNGVGEVEPEAAMFRAGDGISFDVRRGGGVGLVRG